MTWRQYATAVLVFSLVSFLAVYGLQRFQDVLPLNPESLPAVSPDLSFNTAVSFVTNTNWQGYGGETTMSYLTQMLALTVQNFVSAAAGMAVLVALIRGFTRRAVGNHRQLLGRSRAGNALHPAAFVAGSRCRSGFAGRRSDDFSVSRCDAARTDRRCCRSARDDTAHRRRPSGFADCDQTAGHQWRRFLQRQLGSSVGESDTACRTFSKCWRSC